MLRNLLVATALLAASPTSAQWSPDGALTGLAQIEVGSEERRVGGGLLVDVLQGWGAFRLGFSAGIGALTSGNDEVNRIFAPLGVAMGLASSEEATVGVVALARAGLWAGADKAGLRGGGWIGGGAQLAIRFDPRLQLGAGVDLWLLTGERSRTLIVPTLSLRWTAPDE